MSEIPGMTIAGDNVDPEWVAKPRRCDTRFISRYMVLFGLVSSIFDFLTFGMLLFLFHAGAEGFRTGWFVESLLTELVIALVVGPRRVFFRNHLSVGQIYWLDKPISDVQLRATQSRKHDV